MPFPFKWPKHFDKNGVMTVPALYTHDHELVIGGTTYRFKLARDSKGAPMCDVINESGPYTPGILRFSQNDWKGGHGVYDAPGNDGFTTFFDGQSIDVTQEGRVILGPEIQSPAVYNLVDYAVAADGAVLTTETTGARNVTGNDMTLLPATPATNDAYYFGSAATFTGVRVDIGTPGVGTWTITWEYYNGSTWASLSGVVDNTTGFTAAAGVRTCSFTLPGDWATTTVNSISAYWVRARVSAYSAVTTQPLGDQAWVQKSGLDMGENPVCFCWFPATARWYCATTTKVYEWSEGGSAWVHSATFTGETITQMNVFEAAMYVGLGASTKYYYTTSGFNWTQTDLTDGFAVKMLTAPNLAGTADVLWKFKTPNEISNTTDGRTVAAGGVQWEAATYIGDTSDNISNLFMLNDQLMIGRVDNLFYHDPNGGIYPLMSELLNNRSTQNFKYIQPWKTSVYASLVTGISEFSGFNIYESVGPLYGNGDIGKVGTCVGEGAEKDFIYVAMDEGTNTHIYKGRIVTDAQGNSRWAWCPWVFVGTNACAVIGVCQHSTTIRRLWFGYGNTAAYVTITDNPTTDSTARFAASGFVRMSYWDAGHKYSDKLVQSIVTYTKGCAAGITVQPTYRKDTDTDMTNLTAAISQNGTILTNLSSQVAGKRIQFELDLATNNSAITPEVLYFEARGIEKPEMARIHDVTYYISDMTQESMATLRNNLRSAYTSTSLIKLADLRLGESTATSNYVWVIVLPGFPVERELRHEVDRRPEMGIHCQFKEVSYTIS